MQEDVTLKAQAGLVEKARARAQAMSTTLEEELHRWLETYASEEEATPDTAAWFAAQVETMQKLRLMSA
jgi:hypothetical protein